MAKKYQKRIKNRLLVWFIIGALVPLLFIVLSVVFYLAPVSTLQELVELIKRTLLIPILASLILILTLSFFMAREITDPIKRLQQAVNKIMKGAKGVKVVIETNDELAELADSFNQMTTDALTAKQQLEVQIKERTQKLISANEELQESKTAMLNILEDMEEEKNKAQEQKNKIETIIKSIGDGVVVTNKSAKVIMTNAAAESLLDLKVDSIGKSFDKLLKFYNEEGERLSLSVKSFIESKQPSLLINKAVYKSDNSKKYLDIHLSKFKNIFDQVMGVVIICRDVSKSVEIDKMKSEFVSVASHQLRTPLSAVKWFLEMLLAGDLGKINDEQEEVLTDALASNERMIFLVNDLLNVSRLESAKIKVEPRLTSLNKLINMTLKELKSQAVAKKIKIDDSEVTKVPKIKIDPSLLSQVIQNLISNAIKYSKNNSKVSLRLKEQDKEIIFSVTDRGVGIPARQQDRVFEKFFRADNVTKMETEGTGLGLYISKLLVELSGGKIWFESSEGQGTIFSFLLPKSGSKARAGNKSITQII